MLLLDIALYYLIIGGVFGVIFFLSGYKIIDARAADARWYLRLLWLPAAIFLWWILIYKMWKNKK